MWLLVLGFLMGAILVWIVSVRRFQETHRELEVLTTGLADYAALNLLWNLANETESNELLTVLDEAEDKPLDVVPAIIRAHIIH